MMNQEIKTRWTAALRSGEYRQGRSFLRTGDSFCCLGVLCDLAVKAGIIGEVKPALAVVWGYGPEEASARLPSTVVRWAGLSENNPRIRRDNLPQGVKWWLLGPGEGGTSNLADANDGGTPFAVIADIIDAQF